MRVAVIGAGPTGLTVAHRLALSGDQVEVFEASPHVGGLARSLSLWGHRVDLGSHIFSTSSREVADLWARLAGTLRMLELRRGIWTGSALLPYPLQPLPVARAFGARATARATVGAVRARLSRRSDIATAEDAVVARYGRPLYDSLFRNYAEKLWGLPGSSIDAAFATALVGESDASRKTDALFAYPARGTGSVWEAMAEEIAEHGGNVHLSSPITALLTDGHTVRGLHAAGLDHEADVVVSTMPAHLLLGALPPAPAEVTAAAASLRARSTVLVYLHVSGTDGFPHNWVYVYPDHLRVGRLTSFAAWEEHEGPDSIVSLEYWCSPDDDLWSASDSELIDLAARELAATGLLGRPSIGAGHVERLRGTHPVFDLGFGDRVAAVQDHLSRWHGLLSAGRHGRHGLPGVGACMEEAFALAALLHS